MEYLSSNKIAVIDLGTKEIVEEELDQDLGQGTYRRGRDHDRSFRKI